MTSETEEGGRFARWSRRKLAARTGAVDDEEREVEAAIAPDAATAEENPEHAANRAAAEAVDLDALDYASDFTVFLREGVPDFLKRKALRKLWTSNPVLANLDGLNDYDEDFNDPKTAFYKSAWDVARGYLAKLEPLESPAEAEAAGDAGIASKDEAGNDAEGAAAADEAESDRETEGLAERVAAAPEGEEPAAERPQRVSIRSRLAGV